MLKIVDKTWWKKIKKLRLINNFTEKVIYEIFLEYLKFNLVDQFLVGY